MVFDVTQIPVPMKAACIAALRQLDCLLLDVYQSASAFEVEQHLREHLILRQGKT